MAAKRVHQVNAGLSEGYVSLEELYVAYRKAKVDTFYEREICLGFEFVEFEEKLHENLKRVLDMLRTGSWTKDPAVLGTCSFIPKSLDFELSDPSCKPVDQSRVNFKTIHTSSARSWADRLLVESREGRKPVAQFRPMARPSVDWLVISSLWIMKAGRKLDACLGDCARGSRLRTHKDGKFNETALGCFASYAPAYGKWREDGLKVIRHELTEGRGSIAITADLKSFYHSVDPEFLNDEKFESIIKKREVELEKANPEEAFDSMNQDDWRFTSQLVGSFREWAELNKNLLPNRKAIGLPIGPGAARVVANLALIGFDRFIEHEVQPLYYGRYVDDVFLVIRDGTGVENGEDVWSRIEKLSRITTPSPCQIKIEAESDRSSEMVCRMYLDYDMDKGASASRSDLRFGGKKQKIFFVEGGGGDVLVGAIEQQIRENSSEWRQLPELPSFEEDFQDDFLVANPDVTEPADNLRKADKVSIRRLKFAFHLRDLEAFAEDLEVKDWAVARRRLYEFTESQLLALPEFFVYATYLPRIFGLAAHARDWVPMQRLVRKIGVLFKRLRVDCHEGLDPRHLNLCKQDLGFKLIEAICRALPWRSDQSTGSYKEFKVLKDLLQREFKQPEQLGESRSKQYRSWARRLFVCDLARAPFRRVLMSGELLRHQDRVVGDEYSIDLQRALGLRSIAAFLTSLFDSPVKVPLAMAFPTRPLTPGEIGLLDPSLLSAKRAFRFQEFVRAIRGTHFSGLDDARCSRLRKWFGEQEGEDSVIWIPDAEFSRTVRISLPCITLSDESWAASITGKSDPDVDRYTRIARLINEILKSERKPDYVILPELSLKSDWFNRFALKLEKSGVSLMAGVEYAHPPFENIKENEVVNSVRVSMVTRFPGYRTHLLYSQNKMLAAPGERSGLMDIGGKTLVGGRSRRMIIRHGDFQFAILICSELSNIESRAALRGRIDALFVPEWNKDTDGFASLIESSALDLHCFVVQSNNRRYGDSRIRAPHKDSWDRDIIRLKGGCQDFHASGEIDFLKLRKFQSNHNSPVKPFKPVPDGFKIHPSRQELPSQ